MSRSTDPLVEVRNLKKHYPITKGFLSKEVGRTRAVDGISFELNRGETLGIVGESGCGKSTAATSMIRLEEPTDGEILFEGEDIMGFSSAELQRFRREAQMIFQDPDSSLDPRMSVGDSIAEPLIVQGMNDADRREAIVCDLLERVGLSAADRKRYPHEFSGGQKQRIGLARALAVNPQFIVADEPVSALDVSVQSEILKLIDEFQQDFGLTMLVISHNLGVVREVCDRVAVMYLGEFVEVAPTEELFSDPQHPYTQALLSAIPTPDPTDRGLGQELVGDVPDPANPPSGCRFHTRCPKVIQPDGINLPQSEWQNVLLFRKHVENGGLDMENIVTVHAIESDSVSNPDSATPETVDNSMLAGWIRDEYELPTQLTDMKAETVLDDALMALVTNDTEEAISILEANFTTPCEETKPALESDGLHRESACLLVDSTQSGNTIGDEPSQFPQSSD